MKRICVYCGSNPGRLPQYRAAAAELAAELIKRELGLVYGGASVGVMGELANRMLEGGGEVIGVMPQPLVDKEIAHRGLTDLHVVTTMHERKALMADLADGFIALPGGFGTLEELFEILTWLQLGVHDKPCGLLNTDDYYSKLQAFIEHAVNEEFIKPQYQTLLLIEQTPQALLNAMTRFTPPLRAHWIKPQDT